MPPLCPPLPTLAQLENRERYAIVPLQVGEITFTTGENVIIKTNRENLIFCVTIIDETPTHIKYKFIDNYGNTNALKRYLIPNLQFYKKSEKDKVRDISKRVLIGSKRNSKKTPTPKERVFSDRGLSDKIRSYVPGGRRRSAKRSTRHLSKTRKYKRNL